MDKDLEGLIIRDFELASLEAFQNQEDPFRAVFEEYLAYLIENKLEYLLNILYRLDIDEQLINQLFLSSQGEFVNVELANIIFERQEKRLATKRDYPQPGNKIW